MWPRLHQVAEQRRRAVVAQPAGVNPGRHEIVAQRIHLDQRRELGGVAVIVGELALGQAGAGGRFDGDDARALAGETVEHVGQRQAAEIAAAAEAADHHVRLLAGHAAFAAWLPGRSRSGAAGRG